MPNNDFFEKASRRVDLVFRWMPVFLVGGAVVGLTILGLLGYVAYHFLMKVW